MSATDGSHVFLESFSATKLPFYNWLYVVYKSGDLAVDLFFGLSGFIFFWLFSDNIQKQVLCASEFSIHRFSRLYPLHLVTLLWILALQVSSYSIGIWFDFFNGNDTRHFILTLLFASAWGLGNWRTFNTPVWSVSVEIILYAIFYVFCRNSKKINTTKLVLMATIGLALNYKINHQVGRGIFSFFMGGCTYHYYKQLVQSGQAKSALVVLIPATLVLFLTMVAGIYLGWDIYLNRIPLLWRYTFLPAIIFFQALILLLALTSATPCSGKKLMMRTEIET